MLNKQCVNRATSLLSHGLFTAIVYQEMRKVLHTEEGMPSFMGLLWVQVGLGHLLPCLLLIKAVFR